MKPIISQAGFDLLAKLKTHNNREWYKAHKAQFEAELLIPFAATLESISEALHIRDMEFSGGKETMFRMNRDIRFSKDKSPYKTNVSGLLTPGGTKAEGRGFVYLHLQNDESFAAFGRYKLNAKALAPIRDKVIEQPDRFGKILTGLTARGLDLVRTDTLSSMPRGYSEYSEHQFAAELKLTNMMVRIELPNALWLNGDVVDDVVDYALICQDLIAFLSVQG